MQGFPVTVVIVYETQPGKGEAGLVALSALVKTVVAEEPACLGITVSRDVSDPTRILLTEEWAEKWRGNGIVVNAMHPGWADTPAVRTSLPRFHAVTKAILRSPEEGADTVVWLAASPAAEGRSGLFWFDRAPAATTPFFVLLGSSHPVNPAHA